MTRKKKGTAHGCEYQAQENPPEGEEQEEDNPPVPTLDPEGLLEKEDISLQVSFSPHVGHA